MQKITVKLETVTPLFLGGAEPRGEPELRPPAFRGAMRYWLRALLGASVPDDPDRIKEIQKREAEVFGSAQDESGASAVGVRISYGKDPAINIYAGDRPRRDTIKDKTVIRPTGKDYLYWSMKQTRDESAHQYFPPATFFDLHLASRAGASKSAFDLALKALWLTIQLGGVGSRSRRTGGSLSISEPLQVNNLNFLLSSGKLAGRELSHGLKTILGESSTSKNFPDYDVLASGACSIWLIRGEKQWRSWEEAVKEIGEKLCDARTYSAQDKQNVIKWIDGEQIDTVQRSVYGLPLTFKYSNGKGGTVQGQNIERRASPLWLKVSKTANGDCVGVATLFKADFLPAGEKLHLKTRANPPLIKPPPDYSLIENWVTESFKTEVIYE